tara:strand:- start:11729 stop:11863 length:135 start_codon:yes stop_codon:yes gene_type:complete
LDGFVASRQVAEVKDDGAGLSGIALTQRLQSFSVIALDPLAKVL